MKLFVSESVCGGAWRSGERPLSLLREGLAMLQGFVTDAVSAGCRITTTWDQRLGVPESLERTGVQIIPINDRSTDGTKAIIDDFAARHPELVRPLHRDSGATVNLSSSAPRRGATIDHSPAATDCGALSAG